MAGGDGGGGKITFIKMKGVIFMMHKRIAIYTAADVACLAYYVCFFFH
jgi:hypothetical protein